MNTIGNRTFATMQKYLLLVTVFFCGMSVMIIELVGSRVVAPYVGTSVYVWTSLIGILLGSLSLGYYVGGRFADKGATLQGLAAILFLAGVSTSAILYLKYAAYAVGIFSTEFTPVSIILAPFLFVPATFFFGMSTPYIARLHITSVETSGSTIGRLYALSTVGSIFGTFLGGFVLISYFGNSKILVILGVLTIVLSLLIYGAQQKR